MPAHPNTPFNSPAADQAAPLAWGAGFLAGWRDRLPVVLHGVRAQLGLSSKAAPNAASGAGPVAGPSTWRAITPGWVACGLAGLALLVALSASWRTPPGPPESEATSATAQGYKTLFAGLSDKDGGAVLAQLTQRKVPYRHSEDGSAILVPAAQVHTLRMQLGMLGLPKAAVGGYELLDAARFGQSAASENLIFKRALEGELTRSISSLAGVERARVLLALPSSQGSFREPTKASASVLLSLMTGQRFNDRQLAGVAQLVAASVPGLSADAVTVVDQHGSLLTGSAFQGSAAAAGATAAEAAALPATPAPSAPVLPAGAATPLTAHAQEPLQALRSENTASSSSAKANGLPHTHNAMPTAQAAPTGQKLAGLAGGLLIGTLLALLLGASAQRRLRPGAALPQPPQNVPAPSSSATPDSRDPRSAQTAQRLAQARHMASQDPAALAALVRSLMQGPVGLTAHRPADVAAHARAGSPPARPMQPEAGPDSEFPSPLPARLSPLETHV